MKISKILSPFICALLTVVISLLARTCRYREIGLQNLYRAKSSDQKRGYLLACWHETVIGMTLAQKGRLFCAISSRSAAGNVVAHIIKKLGFYSIQGSRSNGGKEVRASGLEYLSRGVSVAITVDGSKGPRRIVKPGIVDLAIKSGALILPGSVHIDHFWTLNTWDKFRIPMPFSRITIVYGEPIFVASDTTSTSTPSFADALGRVAVAINSGEIYAQNLTEHSEILFGRFKKSS